VRVCELLVRLVDDRGNRRAKRLVRSWKLTGLLDGYSSTFPHATYIGSGNHISIVIWPFCVP
jgi:hypothetical protein